MPRFCRFEKDPSAFRPQDDRWSVGTARINAGTRRAARRKTRKTPPRRETEAKACWNAPVSLRVLLLVDYVNLKRLQVLRPL